MDMYWCWRFIFRSNVNREIQKKEEVELHHQEKQLLEFHFMTGQICLFHIYNEIQSIEVLFKKPTNDFSSTKMPIMSEH